MHEENTGKLLNKLFAHSLEQFSAKTAIICDKKTISYQELDDRSTQIANHLLVSGLKQQDSVGILLERSVDNYVFILAIVKAGLIYVPLEIDYPDERINFIVQDMNLNAIILTPSEEKRRGLILPSTTQILYSNQLISKSIQKNSLNTLEMSSNPSDVCYVIYTSGSTGQPKGVQVTHENIAHYVAVASRVYKMSHSDRVYQGFSLGFDASLEELWMALANAAVLITTNDKDIRYGIGLIEFLNQHKITFFSTVPSLLNTLEGELPYLRLLILGGEVCSNRLIKKWHRSDLRILNTYGPTEATVVTTYFDCLPYHPITIGKPLPGYEVLILDENLKKVAHEQPGEIHITGKAIAKGYINQPHMTEQKFITLNEKRYYKTGDLAKYDNEGNIHFIGRRDEQIKLRGFRIELNEIEKHIESHPAVKQAIVLLHQSNNPSLLAYVLPHSNEKKPLNLEALKKYLKDYLPHYMFPSFFQIVEIFPLLSSGKVDRKKLLNQFENENLEHSFFSEKQVKAPQSELEKKMLSVWESGLNIQNISIDDDFFYDLGGHSLLAANIISNLRRYPELQDISILDLYQHASIEKLAQKFSNINKMANDQAKVSINHEHKKYREAPRHASNLSYYLCGLGQFFGILLQYAVSSWQLLAVILCYEWLNMDNLLSIKSLIVFSLLFLLMPIISLTLTISAKWLLVGKIKPGVYKVWGWFYFRWWLAERLQKNIFSPRHLIGSPLIILYYRLLGAKIGKNCYIGSVNFAIHDLISIGDNSSIGFDARLLGYVVEDGWLKIGSITVGKNCFVGCRSLLSINTTIQDEGKLEDMSMVPSEGTIPAQQFFSGSPAKPTICPDEHVTTQIQQADPISGLQNFFVGLSHYFGLVLIMVMYYLCYFPALLLISHFHEQTHNFLTIFLAAPIGAMVFLSLHYLGIAVFKKILMNRTKPGIYRLKSLFYIRQWMSVKMIDIEEVFIMADSLYLPSFLRFLGAKLGKHVEVGEMPHVIADLLTIKDEGFIASSVALAWPSVYLGHIKYAPIEVGKKGFAGNVSLVPLGNSIGEEGLLGCMSITPPNNQAAEHKTAWLGSPAVFLPKREIITGFSQEETLTPPKRLFLTRLCIEFARIILPTTLTLIELFCLLSLMTILFQNYSLLTILAILPIAQGLLTLAIVAFLIGLKWLLLGRVKPAIKPIWNIFIWKNDLVEYLFTYYICPHFTLLAVGTPFMGLLLRAFGSKVGKKTFINTISFAEFDLISIGNESYINTESIIQTHLYEDRIFKMSTVEIQNGCNIGTASIVLYTTIMEEYSTLGNFSLLMKGEQLPAYTSWQGVPAQPMVYQYKITDPELAFMTKQSLVEI